MDKSSSQTTIRKSLQNTSLYNPISSTLNDKESEIHEEPEESEEISVPGVDEIRKLFIKDCLIVCYHPDAYSEPIMSQFASFEHLPEFRVFCDWKEAYEVIETTQANFGVITFGTSGEILIDKTYENKKIFSIGVICADVNVKTQLKVKYKKDIQVENDLQSMIQRIKEKSMKLDKTESALRFDLPTYCPIFNDYEKSENNYLHVYLTQLAKFGNREQSKKDFLKLARTIYRDESEMKNFEQNYNKYDTESILKWYSKESFLMKLTNNCLRFASPDLIFYSRFVLNDLETAIKEQYILESHTFNGLLYRGAYMTNEDWTKLLQNKGQEIEIYGFLSATKLESVAEAFAQENRDQKIFITIIVPSLPEKGGQGFAVMKKFSDYGSEEEVLFNVRSRFRIIGTTSKKAQDGYVFRHLILLYGTQEINEFMRLNNQVIPVDWENIKKSCCLRCKSKTEAQGFGPCVDLEKPGCYVCYNCLIASQDLNIPALALVKDDLNTNLKVEGMVVRNQGKDILSLLECVHCHTNKMRERFFCIGCDNKVKEWCNNCFDEANDCAKAGHTIIIENEPYSFWPKRGGENKYLFKELFAELNPGELFRTTTEFERGREFLERALEKMKGTSNKKSALYQVQLANIYTDLDQNEKAKEYSSKAIETFKLIYNGEEKHMEVGFCYILLGRAFVRLGRLDDALESYLKASEIFKTVLDEGDYRNGILFMFIGEVYEKKANWEEAIKWYLDGLKISKAFYGDDHPYVVCSFSGIGSVLAKSGQLDKAKEYYTNQLKVTKQIFGDKHNLTESCYFGLGSVHEKLGEFNEAIKCYSNALRIQKAIYGDKHSSSARTYNSLGTLYNTLGQQDKAIKNHKSALEINKEVYGEKHEHVATSYNNIGVVLKELKRYDEALDYFSKALDIRKEVLGDEHPNVAECYTNIGLIHSNLEKFDKALEYQLKALKIIEPTNQEKTPQAEVIYNNLGEAYHKLKDLDNALKYFQTSLEIKKAIYGDKHHLIAGAYLNIGNIYDGLENFTKAIEYYWVALKMWREFYGEKHPMIVLAYDNLGCGYEGLKQYEESVKYRKIALDMSKEIHGGKDLTTALCYDHLGNLHHKMGQVEKAIDYYWSAVEIKRAHNAYIDPTHYEFFGALYMQIKQPLKAIECFSCVVEIWKVSIGDNHPCLINSYTNLGTLWETLGNRQRALEYYEKVLLIKKAVDGDKHPETAAWYDKVGSIYSKLIKLEKAIECYKNAFKIRKEVYGNNHDLTAESYANMGMTYGMMRKPKEAVACLMRALNIIKIKYGDKHEFVANAYHNLGTTYMLIGEFAKAGKCYLKILQIRIPLYGYKHPLTRGSYNNLCSVYARLGQLSKAYECFLKCWCL